MQTTWSTSGSRSVSSGSRWYGRARHFWSPEVDVSGESQNCCSAHSL